MVLHGVRADPRPLGTGVWGLAFGDLRTQQGGQAGSSHVESCLCASSLPPTKLDGVALPSLLQELQFGVREA